jgi:DNA-binding transcriptional LysR family regulator
MRNKVIGRVRLAAIYSVGLLQMDTYAKRYKTLFPDVVLQLEYLHPDEVYSRVLNDESDLGIVSYPRTGNEIASVPWQNQEIVLAVPRGHRYAARPSVTPKELNGETFVGFTSELTIRKQIDRWFKQAGISVDFVHLFDNVENIKRAVEIGSGIALLPAPTVRREAETGSLFAVPIEGSPWHRPLGIIHRRNRTLTNPARKLVELLRESPELIVSRGSERA